MHGPDYWQDLIVPETNDSEALRFQPRRAFRIGSFLFQMMSAIDFNDQSFFETHRINDIWSNGSLPAKSAPQHLTLSKCPPQRTFGFGGGFLSCLALVTVVFVWMLSPPP